MLLGSSSICGNGSLHIWKGSINDITYIEVLQKHIDMTSFSWKVLHISER